MKKKQNNQKTVRTLVTVHFLHVKLKLKGKEKRQKPRFNPSSLLVNTFFSLSLSFTSPFLFITHLFLFPLLLPFSKRTRINSVFIDFKGITWQSSRVLFSVSLITQENVCGGRGREGIGGRRGRGGEREERRERKRREGDKIVAHLVFRRKGLIFGMRQNVPSGVCKEHHFLLISEDKGKKLLEETSEKLLFDF